MPTTRQNKFIPFISPLELMLFYDDDLRDGIYELYEWQIRLLNEFARPLAPEDISYQALIAANGSGKSKIIMAPCVTWLASQFSDTQCSVTSASAQQLDTQTERYIDMLCSEMNKKHREDFGLGEDIWHKPRRHKVFKLNGSHIDLFATDEPGKAEGAHPLVFGGELGIFIDEGKSVLDDIYRAVTRCTGITRRLDISSPGTTRGHFYDVCTNPELVFSMMQGGRLEIMNPSKQETGWRVHKVTAFDCPHIRKSEIENAIIKYGLHDPLVRSAFFAEFTSIDEKTVISFETLRNCVRIWKDLVRDKQDSNFTVKFGLHAGLDLSAGGDENVFSVWDGNIQIAQETARYKNTIEGTKEIIHWIDKHGMKQLCNKIWADDGGIGRGIIDNLHARGYVVNRVLNQHRAKDNTRYANRGTEIYFNFKRFIEEAQVKLLQEPILHSQLSNRYYSQPNNNKLQLESKPQARANGHPSPDRADACVLAWCEYSYPLNNDVTGVGKPINVVSVPIDDLAQILRNRNRDKLNGFPVDCENNSRHVITQGMMVDRMLSRGGENHLLKKIEKRLRYNN